MFTNERVVGVDKSDRVAGGYLQIPQKFYHPNAGRNALGLVGGNEVSLASGNLVDVESELRNITRDLSKAPAKQYRPSCPLGTSDALDSTVASVHGTCPSWPKSFSFIERSTQKVQTVSTAPRHLPTMQNATYAGVPAPKPLSLEVYGAPWRF
jgi:hypothetical protein